MLTISVVFYALLSLCVLISFCITLFVLGAMWLRRSSIKTDRVNYLLLLNGYMDFIVACPVFLEMSIRSIYGQLHPDSNFDGWECLLKGLIYQLNGCVYFYSFLLQAIYRFCRIVHPDRRLFQSFLFYAILSVAQWIVAIAFLIVCLLLGYIAYLPDEYHCQFVTSNLHGSVIGMVGLFVLPFSLTLMLYFYAMYYVRTQTSALTTINRDANIRRDLLVLTRLVLLFSFVSAVGLPHLIVPVIYAIFGDVASWAVSFTWLMTFLSLASVSIIQIFVSPHLRKLFVRFTRVHHIPKRTLTINNN